MAEIEARVDRRQHEIKTYLSRMGSAASVGDRQQAIEILDHVINLEHVGDIIDRNLGPAVRKKAEQGLRMTDEGYAEIERLFLMTAENMRTAQTVFMTRDRELAQNLIREKVSIRNFERASSQRHLARLSAGHPAARQTSSLHLDVLRDLKRINAHLVSVAHPILDESGMLAESRLIIKH